MNNTRIPDLHYHLTIGVTLEQFFKQPINRAIDAEDTAVAYGTIKQLDGIRTPWQYMPTKPGRGTSAPMRDWSVSRSSSSNPSRISLPSCL